MVTFSRSIFPFEIWKTGKNSFTGKVSTHSPDLRKAGWGTPMQNSQANPPRTPACTADASSSSVLNWVNTLHTCPGEMQLNDHLGESTSLALHPPSKAVGSSSPMGCPHTTPVVLHLSSLCFSSCFSPWPVAAQGSTGESWAQLRTHFFLPSPKTAVVACLSGLGRRVQQLLLLPGWPGGWSRAQKPRFSSCSCCG